MNRKPTKTDLKKMETLCGATAWSMDDKDEALKLVRKYVNPSTHFCLTCDSSVRLMMGQLRHFYQNHTYQQ